MLVQRNEKRKILFKGKVLPGSKTLRFNTSSLSKYYLSYISDSTRADCTRCVTLSASTHHFLRLRAAESCCENGGAALQVIWRASTWSAAADGDGVNAAAVAVAGAVVASAPSVPRRPYIKGAPPLAAL